MSISGQFTYSYRFCPFFLSFCCCACESLLHYAEHQPGTNALMRLWHEHPGLGEIGDFTGILRTRSCKKECTWYVGFHIEGIIQFQHESIQNGGDGGFFFFFESKLLWDLGMRLASRCNVRSLCTALPPRLSKRSYLWFPSKADDLPKQAFSFVCLCGRLQLAGLSLASFRRRNIIFTSIHPQEGSPQWETLAWAHAWSQPVGSSYISVPSNHTHFKILIQRYKGQNICWNNILQSYHTSNLI